MGQLSSCCTPSSSAWPSYSCASSGSSPRRTPPGGRTVPYDGRSLAVPAHGHGHSLERDARRDLAGRGPLVALDRRGRRAISGAGPDPLFDLRGDPGDARRAGALLARAHPGPGGRRDRRTRGSPGPDRGGRVDARAPGGAGQGGVVREDTAERVRALYGYRRRRFAARLDGDESGLEERSAAYQRLMRELLRAQRQTLMRLRNEGKIGDEAMHHIERDLDLEESRLEVTPI